MWTELTRADIERVKQQLQTRRSDMVARHAAELAALDAEETELTVLEEAIDSLVRKFGIGGAEVVTLKAAASWSSEIGDVKGELMIEEAPDQTDRDLAVLDEAVLDGLGPLQGKYDAEFVTRMFTIFMETALTLLIRLKEGIASVISPHCTTPAMSWIRAARQ
jgi:hypothetical protein